DENPDTPMPVSFTVKETVCPRSTQQPLELCPFKKNGLVKQCLGTVILDPVKEYFDISCDEVSGPFWVATTHGEVVCGTSYGPINHCPIQGRESPCPSVSRDLAILFIPWELSLVFLDISSL
ncbi:hypothetical protein HPG69_012841, partial [Diceros bicornis minor]